MKTSLNLNHQLPFIQLRIWYKGQSLLLDRILVDTGSASTIFKLDIVEKIGITAEEDDIVGSISRNSLKGGIINDHRFSR